MLKVNDTVKAYKSQCIGHMIESWTYEGTIVKVNKKSIVVNFSKITKKSGSKVEFEREYTGTCKYTFWKEVDGRVIYKSDSKICGIIEF